jgi:hypothetical protein
MKTVESSAVFQPKRGRKKKPGRIENRTQPELLPHQTSNRTLLEVPFKHFCVSSTRART